jgi:hypothetical protein
MIPRTVVLCALILVAATGNASARDFEMGGDNQFPYSIMAPEPVSHHASRHSTKSAKSGRATSPQVQTAPIAEHVTPRKIYAVHGSSGVVLPTPLPKTQLIPPENSGRLTLPTIPSEQGPTILQGAARPIPNLPHGPETFQDRASRCSFQAGLNNVPGNLTNQYIGSCVN